MEYGVSSDFRLPLHAGYSVKQKVKQFPIMFKYFFISNIIFFFSILEVKMAPLYIQPHTVVLQFHRKVPPFKHTVAGE